MVSYHRPPLHFTSMGNGDIGLKITGVLITAKVQFVDEDLLYNAIFLWEFHFSYGTVFIYKIEGVTLSSDAVNYFAVCI